MIYSSEISRGLDIYELVPTPLLSQNEIDAAKTVTFNEANAQDQKEDRLAAELRDGESVRRSTRTVEGPVGGEHHEHPD